MGFGDLDYTYKVSLQDHMECITEHEKYRWWIPSKGGKDRVWCPKTNDCKAALINRTSGGLKLSTNPHRPPRRNPDLSRRAERQPQHETPEPHTLSRRANQTALSAVRNDHSCPPWRNPEPTPEHLSAAPGTDTAVPLRRNQDCPAVAEPTPVPPWRNSRPVRRGGTGTRTRDPRGGTGHLFRRGGNRQTDNPEPEQPDTVPTAPERDQTLPTSPKLHIPLRSQWLECRLTCRQGYNDPMEQSVKSPKSNVFSIVSFRPE